MCRVQVIPVNHYTDSTPKSLDEVADPVGVTLGRISSVGNTPWVGRSSMKLPTSSDGGGAGTPLALLVMIAKRRPA